MKQGKFKLKLDDTFFIQTQTSYVLVTFCASWTARLGGLVVYHTLTILCFSILHDLFLIHQPHRATRSDQVYMSSKGERAVNFEAHPCSLLAVCPGESREAVGALQDKYREKNKKEVTERRNTLDGWRVWNKTCLLSSLSSNNVTGASLC